MKNVEPKAKSRNIAGGSFKTYLQSLGLSKSTIHHYNSYIIDFISWLDADNTEIENSTAKEITAYLSHLKNKGQSNFTRSIRLKVISHFMNYQIQHNHRTDNPAKNLKLRGTKQKKLYPILSKQELEQLYNTYKVPDENDEKSNRNWFTAYRLSKQRNKAILSLLVNQGLTTAEITRLKVNDLKLKEGTIYMTGSRKSNERILELKPNQIMELMEYALQTRQMFIPYQEDENTKRLFLSVPSAGKKEANDTLQIFKGLTNEIKNTNPKIINFKQVRTSVITHWLKQYNLRQVQYMAGHRYVSSTEAYLVNQMEDLQADIDKFHPF